MEVSHYYLFSLKRQLNAKPRPKLKGHTIYKKALLGQKTNIVSFILDVRMTILLFELRQSLKANMTQL